jgi:2-polyprenyl-3-methyl-5-hydroxy-6-metoxy-1,4-benzoquinol methylase
MQKQSSLETYVALFSKYGVISGSYFTDHYVRFQMTLEEFLSTWKRVPGQKVLDVGAHWLHQAIMWREQGFDVTAFDLPLTFKVESVKNIAADFDIFLLGCVNMEKPIELNQVPSDSFDIILFSEIIEHITFNPVLFWKEIHRVLKKGGRIVITTPNYYSAKSRAWHFWRYLTGRGGGISVADVLGIHTYAHHWREYSKAEVIEYFRLLSPDFTTRKARYITYSRSKVLWKRLIQNAVNCVPFLRPNLHVEIELSEKSRGIVVEPRW